MKNLKLMTIIIFLLQNSVFGQVAQFTKLEIEQDLKFLKSTLITKHPNLNIYSSQSEIDSFFTNIKISNTVTELEAFSLFSSAQEVIKDGHTLFYPSKKRMASNNLNQLFCPFQPFWHNSKLYIIKNYATTNQLPLGAEIISINGIQSEELINGMLKKMMQEGTNYNYPTWALNNYFFEYYSYFFGCVEEFKVVYQIDQIEKEIVVKGIAKTTLFQQMKKQSNKIDEGISLKIDKEKGSAILTINNWHSAVFRKYYKKNFIVEIKKVIKELEKEKIQNLIIDIRDNQGGDTKNSRFLLSYLLNEPFILIEAYFKKKNGELQKCHGPQSGTHKPLSKTFQGDIYVLINGGSFSNSGVFCSVLRKHNRATFIGEPSGGNEFVICGSSKVVTLPNTGIQIEVPQLQFFIKNYEDGQAKSVVPDFYVEPNITDLLNQKDKDLEFTFELIEQKK